MVALIWLTYVLLIASKTITFDDWTRVNLVYEFPFLCSIFWFILWMQNITKFLWNWNWLNVYEFIITIKCCCLARTTTHRRSMGLPPAQGHNNLRLNTTANYYPKYRLDTKHYNKTRKPKQTLYPNLLHPSIPLCPHLHHPKVERRRSSQSSRLFGHKASPDRTRRHTSHESQSSHRLRPSLTTSHRKSNRSRSVQPPNSILSQKMKRYFSSNNEQRCRYLDRSFENVRKSIPFSVNAPIVSNMPLTNVNSSIFLVNHSPFGLQDPRVGIFHHCAQSISYFSPN